MESKRRRDDLKERHVFRFLCMVFLPIEPRNAFNFEWLSLQKTPPKLWKKNIGPNLFTGNQKITPKWPKRLQRWTKRPQDLNYASLLLRCDAMAPLKPLARSDANGAMGWVEWCWEKIESIQADFFSKMCPFRHLKWSLQKGIPMYTTVRLNKGSTMCSLYSDTPFIQHSFNGIIFSLSSFPEKVLIFMMVFHFQHFRRVWRGIHLETCWLAKNHHVFQVRNMLFQRWFAS